LGPSVGGHKDIKKGVFFVRTDQALAIWTEEN